MGTFLVAQCWRRHLPAQGTWVWSLVRELRSHMLQGNQAHTAQLEKPAHSATEPHSRTGEALAPQPERRAARATRESTCTVRASANSPPPKKETASNSLLCFRDKVQALQSRVPGGSSRSAPAYLSGLSSFPSALPMPRPPARRKSP